MVTPEHVQRWCEDYIAAWRSYDPAAIRALFTDDARYAYEPYSAPLEGVDAILESWVADPDEPGSWEATYAPGLIEGDRAIAKGETRYANGKVFSNLYELEFAADGRCSSFVEWYVLHKQD